MPGGVYVASFAGPTPGSKKMDSVLQVLYEPIWKRMDSIWHVLRDLIRFGKGCLLHLIVKCPVWIDTWFTWCFDMFCTLQACGSVGSHRIGWGVQGMHPGLLARDNWKRHALMKAERAERAERKNSKSSKSRRNVRNVRNCRQRAWCPKCHSS